MKGAVTALILTFSAMYVHAASPSVSLDVKDMKVESIIQKMRKENPSYKFLFNHEEIKGKGSKTISLKDVSLDEALAKVLSGTGLSYSIERNVIVIKPASAVKSEPITVTGNVSDTDGEPLTGATVMIMSTQQGCATDLDGNFTLKVPDNHAVLLISMIGKKPQEIMVGSDRKFTVVLENDQQLMSEIVVTGYQNIKKESATGAYQVVTSKDIDSRTLYSIKENLEGKVAGLVSRGNEDIQIRGVGTLNASRSPLIVVDGLPISGTLDDINSYEIDKITILKDAAAAAVYGARASNGIIVVTTKRAATEKLQVSLNTDWTFVNKHNYDDTHLLDGAGLIELEEKNFEWMMARPDVAEEVEYQYGRRGNLWNPLNRLMMQRHFGQISDADYNSQRAIWAQNNYRKEWQDEMEHTRLQQTYNLTVRNRGKYLSNNLTVNWHGDNTTQKKQFNNNLLLSYVGDLTATKWLDMNFGVTIKNIRSKEHAAGLIDYIDPTSFPAYLSMRNPDGSPARLQAAVYLDEPSLSNPSLGLKDEGFVPLDELNMNYRKSRETYTRSYVHINLYPLSGLKLSAMGQYEDISSRSEKEMLGESYNMRHIYNLYTYNGKHLMPEGGKLTTSSAEANYYTLRFQANYAKRFFDRHDVDLLIGYEYRQTFSKSQSGTLFGYDPQTLTSGNSKLNMYDIYQAESTDLGRLYSAYDGYSTSEAGTNSYVKHRYQSYYATAHYTYDRRYALSASYRVDECDLFGADKKFRRRPLWSIGASWNIHNESFMSDLAFINLLKPRASYGVTGNINTGYSSYLTAKIGTNTMSGDKYASVTIPPNDQLRWEKTKTFNLGLDFALFQYRLNGSLDIYNKKSSDVLCLIDVDPSTGFSSMYNNNADTQNRGVELQLNADVLRGADSNIPNINIAFSIAYNKNRITKINYKPTSGYSALSSYHEGDPINSLYSFVFDHIETDADGYQQIVWQKADGSTLDNRLYYNSDFAPEDVVFSGARDPKWSGSFSPTITWKGLTFSAMLVWYAGHYMRPYTSYWNYSSGFNYGNSATNEKLAWWNMSESEKAQFPGNGYMMYNTHMSSDEARYSNTNIAKADYAKLRNIVISYSFPANICRSLCMQQLRLRFQANNICTLTRNNAGLDPEVVSSMGALSYRDPKSYTVALLVNF
ncbi:MAG: SusC/RagA family TonB-linked outer membrane protein [Paenibacillus sp.]|nr:SusC/RagA family TonB-linked outer membrane protein [Paenibacillus sp.]